MVKNLISMKSRHQRRQQELPGERRSLLLLGTVFVVMGVGLQCGEAQDRAQESITSISATNGGQVCRFAVALPEKDGPLTLGIFSPEGNLVRLLYRDAPIDSIPAGLNGLLISWDGKDDRGEEVPAGIYRARGLVRGRIEASAIAFATDASPGHLPSEEEWRPCFFKTFMPKNRMMVLAARDALFERRPFLSVSAQMEQWKVVLLVDGLPAFEMPIQDTPGVRSVNPLLELHPGRREGTAELTLNSDEGKKSYLINGLDQLVPLDAGSLPFPSGPH
ncbi:MAG: hypothetical protein WCP60_05860 [bacterium]